MLQPIDTKLSSSSSSSSAPSSTLSSSFIFHHQRCYVLSQPLDPSTPSTLSWVQWFHCFALNGSSGLLETVDAQFFTSGFPKSCVTFSLLVMTVVVSPKESTCITPNGTYLFKGGTVLGPTMFKKNMWAQSNLSLELNLWGLVSLKPIGGLMMPQLFQNRQSNVMRRTCRWLRCCCTIVTQTQLRINP